MNIYHIGVLHLVWRLRSILSSASLTTPPFLFFFSPPFPRRLSLSATWSNLVAWFSLAQSHVCARGCKEEWRQWSEGREKLGVSGSRRRRRRRRHHRQIATDSHGNKQERQNRQLPLPALRTAPPFDFFFLSELVTKHADIFFFLPFFFFFFFMAFIPFLNNKNNRDTWRNTQWC